MTKEGTPLLYCVFGNKSTIIKRQRCYKLFLNLFQFPFKYLVDSIKLGGVHTAFFNNNFFFYLGGDLLRPILSRLKTEGIFIALNKNAILGILLKEPLKKVIEWPFAIKNVTMHHI